jgi:hypothetical protein
VFKRSYDHVLRQMSQLSNGVDAQLEQGPVQKEWQDIKQLVEQEALEAKALEQAEAARAKGGGTDVGGSTGATAGSVADAGSSASAGASADFIEKLAKEHLRAYVKLAVEPATTSGVELAVKQSSLCTIHGQERRNVFMILLSSDNLAELAGRAPHRRPPIEFGDLKKLVHGALLGRGGTRETEENPVSMIPGDVVALHDGGRSPVQAMFVDLWRPTHKVLGTVVKHSAVEVKLKKVTLVLNEESVRQLKWRVRGANAYTLVHSVTLGSEQELVPDMCPEKQRSYYKGYNVSDAMGFLNLEPYSKVWQAEVQKKRDIYGPQRMLTPKDDSKDTETPKKDDLQPVFFHQLPVDYYLELIHSFNVVGMLDLAAGGGHAAQACLTKRIPYLGFGLTETHVVELEKFLHNWVRDMMGTEGHPLCRKGAPAPRNNDKDKGPEKDKETNKEKDKEKGKEKKRKTVSSSDVSEVESDEEAERQKKKRKSVSTMKKKKQAKRKKASDESDSDSF